MLGLIGPHVNRVIGGIPELIVGWQPAAVLTLDADPVWRWVQAQCPETVFCYRLYQKEQTDWNDAGVSPKGKAAEQVGRVMRALASTPGVFRYVQGENEPVVNSLSAMQRYAAFEAERTRLLAGYGLRAGLGSFAVGNPGDLKLWAGFEEALRVGREHGAVLFLHAYDWPTLREPDGRWFLHRDELVYGGEPSMGWEGLDAELQLPVYLTEVGLDAGARQPGTVMGFMPHTTAEGYVAELAAADLEFQSRPWIHGAMVYCLGDPGWWSYDVWPEVAGMLAERAQPIRRWPLDAAAGPVRGIDVSEWQGEFDWARARRDGYEFAAIRSSVGLRVDRRWHQNSLRSEQAGFVRHMYHFLTAYDSPVDQARFVAQQVNAARCNAVWVDVERDPDRRIPSAEQTLQFCEALDALTHMKTGIYTSRFMAALAGFGSATWARYRPWWVADWGKGRTSPRLPDHCPDWKIWQTTSSGQVAGRRVDLDVWNGTLEELLAWKAR